MFHPMDPIIITLTRLRNRPIQVFTGYCDTTPYLQLFPGTATLEASCTIKRLMYTYWDPGLPFVWDFLGSFGWQPHLQTGQVFNLSAESHLLNTANKLNDGSFGALLKGVLQEVGNWDETTYYIEPLPNDIVQLVSKLFDQFTAENKQAEQEFTDLLHQMIGSGSYGAGYPGSNGPQGNDAKGIPYADLITKWARNQHLDPALIAALIDQESGFNPNARSDQGAVGLTQLHDQQFKDAMNQFIANGESIPSAQIHEGCIALRQKIDASGGSIRAGVQAYGPSGNTAYVHSVYDILYPKYKRLFAQDAKAPKRGRTSNAPSTAKVPGH